VKQCLLTGVFGDHLISENLWPSGFPILMWPAYWHGYVLHEGITYKSRVPRNSQMTSRLLRHTAAAMRAHNVLCKL
jgi:hypothetical protein